MIHEAKTSTYSHNKGKSQILKASECFNQLQEPHKYYIPLLKKSKQTKNTKQHTNNKNNQPKPNKRPQINKTGGKKTHTK